MCYTWRLLLWIHLEFKLIFSHFGKGLNKLILTSFNLLKIVVLFFITCGHKGQRAEIKRARKRESERGREKRSEEHCVLKYLCRMCGIPSCSLLCSSLKCNRKHLCSGEARSTAHSMSTCMCKCIHVGICCRYMRLHVLRWLWMGTCALCDYECVCDV